MGAIDSFLMRQETYAMLHTANWHRFADYFTSSMRGEKGAGAIRVEGFEMTADQFTRSLVRTLNLAESFYVAPAMNALVTAAAEDWPVDETIIDEDFPTDHGWLWIPGGISTIDIRGQVMTTSAVSWERHGAAVDITWWADKHNDPPWTKREAHWAVQPRLSPWHVTTLHFEQPIPSGLEMGRMLPPEVSREIRYVEGPDGSLGMAFPQGWTPEEMAPRLAADRTTAWLVSALRIMQQPLAAIEGRGLPAAVRKRHMKHPIRVKNTAITVIDFRRRDSDFEPGSGREYSHRFLRRGHWRRQPYKRDDGSWDRRRIWIHATIVGDPDKPLVLRNHVNALTR